MATGPRFWPAGSRAGPFPHRKRPAQRSSDSLDGTKAQSPAAKRFLWQDLGADSAALVLQSGQSPRSRPKNPFLSPLSQHGVAIGVEPVLLPDRLRVGGQYALPAGEGGDQHQQSGAGKVEVGEERVDHLEMEAGGVWTVGINEEIGRAAAGPHLAAPRQRRAFEGADDRGPHRHDPPSGRPGAADRLRGLLADLVALALHPVLLDPLVADGLEGADTDVEAHPRDLYSRLFDRPQELAREVEAGRGGRH